MAKKIIDDSILENMYYLFNYGYSLSSVLEIFKNLKFSSYEVISELMRKYSNNKNVLRKIKEYYQINYKVPDKIVVISDTHIGRLTDAEYKEYKEKGINNKIYSNERGLLAAYNHAAKNNIDTVLHAGDLIDGNNIGEFNYSMSIDDQLFYASELYKNFKNFKSYLLLGNHDIEFNKYIDEIHNLEAIGIRQSYILMGEEFIKISHKCKTDIIVPELPCGLELAGHSHKVIDVIYQCRKIKLPPLSYVNEYNLKTRYIELINDENEYIIKGFNDNENKYKSEYRILKLTNKR